MGTPEGNDEDFLWFSRIKFEMVQAENSRATIQASLLAKAEGYLANFDSADYELLNEENGLVAKRTYDENGISIVISQWKCDGLTMEHLKPMMENEMQLA